MQRLWAPWRMAYIDGLKEPGNCFLCEAAVSSDDAEHLVVLRGRTCFAVLNRYPYNTGHALVAPLVHKGELAELSPEEMLELMELTVRLAAALQRALSPQGFNIGINLGNAAGAGLPGHLHQHIVPRWAGDTNFMSVVGETKVLPDSLQNAYTKLTEALRKGAG